jgi:hypothetical protein
VGDEKGAVAVVLALMVLELSVLVLMVLVSMVVAVVTIGSHSQLSFLCCT